jgi:hypothetical protein
VVEKGPTRALHVLVRKGKGTHYTVVACSAFFNPWCFYKHLAEFVTVVQCVLLVEARGDSFSIFLFIFIFSLIFSVFKPIFFKIARCLVILF